MLLSVEIENVQHIEHCSFEVDLSLNQLQCLVGKNGCGKTTLVRAIRNLSINDTFQQTGAPTYLMIQAISPIKLETRHIVLYSTKS
ncbi:AAA family ATPase [Alteromonas macleodii]|uniref:AAA family ATPase n=1 Tax=Alteromonas macleodii TaxID=28108 RepID=UPI0039F6CBE5